MTTRMKKKEWKRVERKCPFVKIFFQAPISGRRQGLKMEKKRSGRGSTLFCYKFLGHVHDSCLFVCFSQMRVLTVTLIISSITWDWMDSIDDSFDWLPITFSLEKLSQINLSGNCIICCRIKRSKYKCPKMYFPPKTQSSFKTLKKNNAFKITSESLIELISTYI